MAPCLVGKLLRCPKFSVKQNPVKIPPRRVVEMEGLGAAALGFYRPRKMEAVSWN